MTLHRQKPAILPSPSFLYIFHACLRKNGEIRGAKIFMIYFVCSYMILAKLGLMGGDQVNNYGLINRIINSNFGIC